MIAFGVRAVRPGFVLALLAVAACGDSASRPGLALDATSPGHDAGRDGRATVDGATDGAPDTADVADAADVVAMLPDAPADRPALSDAAGDERSGDANAAAEAPAAEANPPEALPAAFGVMLPKFSSYEYDLAPDGSGTLFGIIGADLVAACFDGTSGALTTTVVVDAVPADHPWQVGLAVARAATAKVSLLSYYFLNGDWPSAGYLWYNRIAFLDAGCKLMSAPREPDPDPAVTKVGLVRKPKVAMSADGLAALMYENQRDDVFRLLTYSVAGADVGAVTFKGTECLIGGEFGIGVRATNGDLAVHCFAAGRAGPQFRRFRHDGTAIDAQFVRVRDYYDSNGALTIGVNAFGEIAAMAMTADNTWAVVLFDATPALKASFMLSAPRAYVGAIQATGSGDFLVAQGAAGARLRRDGTFAAVPGLSYPLHVDGMNRRYSTSLGTIVRAPLD